MGSRRDLKELGQHLLEVALLLTAAVSLVTVFNEWHRLIALFAHFRLQYFVVAVLLTAAFLWLRWPRYIVLGVATIALNGWYVIPWYLPVERAAASGPAVRLLNANVLATNGNPARLRKLIEAAEPDIILMQEVTPAWAESLRGLKTRYPYEVIEARDDPFGIALLSKLPIDMSAVNHSSPRDYPEIVASVAVGGRRLQIIGLHAANPISDNGYGDRNLQLAALADLAGRTPRPLIVAGDLNISMWAHPYGRLLDEGRLRNAREGFGVEPTWPVFFPPAMIPIDHFLVSEDIEVTGFTTGSRIGSDHLPILVEIRLGGER